MRIPRLDYLRDRLTADPLWPSFYPRRTCCPTGYYDPVYWSLIALTQMKSGIPANEEAHVIKRVVNANVPCYFLAHDFAQAVWQTEPKDMPALEALHLPLDEMVLVLPVPVSRQVFGFDVGFLSYAIAQAHEDKTRRVFVYHGLLIPSDGLPIGYYGRVPMHEPEPMRSFQGYEYTDRTKIEDEYLVSLGIEPTIHDPSVPLPSPEQDRLLPEKFFSLLYRLFLVLNACPVEYLDKPTLARKPREKHGKVKPGLWTPAFIGKAYCPTRLSLGGHHASPRLHWRRGHTRQQHFGKENSQVKMIWIQPVLVGS